MIQLTNVTKRYGKKVVLDDVSVTFEKGRISCLLGLNGVGKSTTMKAIMGLIPINQGSITMEEETIHKGNIDKLAYIADIPTHDISWTVDENLDIAEVFYESFNREKAERMISFFKLPREKKLKELSKGNLARFNIIMGLSQSTPYVLMDEPFSGIDIFAREEFIAALKSEFLEKNQTVILTTHEIDEVQDIADDIILLEEGRVIAKFTKEEAEANGLSIVEKMRKIYRGV